MIIAIDGPAGAGKSTIASGVATRLGFACLDTGAMYRAIAYRALQNGIATDDAEGLSRIAENEKIEFRYDDDSPAPSAVIISGEDVTDKIRTPEMDMGASDVSAIPSVRKALVEQQRRIGREADYVVEGRDIGSVVFPDAEVKIFLTADPKERALRRCKQNMLRKSGSTEFDVIYADILKRDYNDSHRADSPLVCAEDAIELDTTDMTLDEVITEITKLAFAR